MCKTTSQHSSSLVGKMNHFRSLREKNNSCNRYFHGQTNSNNPFFLCNLFLTSYRWNKIWGERGERFSPSCFHTIMEIQIQIKIIQSPSVPSSASSWWLSNAYFPLALFRLVLPVCDETGESRLLKNVNFPHDMEAGRFTKLLLLPRSALGRVKMSAGERRNKEAVGWNIKKVSVHV